MAKRSRQPEHGLTRLNKGYAIALTLIAVASAVPLASNRPSWWLLWTALISGLGLLHRLFAWWLLPGREPRIKPLAGLFLLAAVVPAYAVVQAQDVTHLLPGWLVAMRSGMEAMRPPTISVVPDASIIGALRFLGYLIFLALVIEVATRRDRVSMMSRILFLGIVLQAIWALVALKMLGDIALFGEKTSYLGMATGTFVNRNSLATFLGFGLVLGAALIGSRFEGPTVRTSRPLGPLERLGAEGQLVLVAMLIIFLALLATQSRLGLAASTVGLTATVLLLLWWKGRLSLRTWVVALPIPLLTAVLVAVSGQGVSDRAIFSEVDSTTRLELYRQVLGMIAVRPWTGFGFDGFGPAFEAFRAPPLNVEAAFDLAHDSYLTLWAEQGLVVGSITPLLLMVVALLLLRRLRRDEDFPGNTAGAIGALVLGAVHSLGDFSLEIPANNYVLLVIIGLGLGRRSPARLPSGGNPVPTVPAAGAGPAGHRVSIRLPVRKDDPA